MYHMRKLYIFIGFKQHLRIEMTILSISRELFCSSSIPAQRSSFKRNAFNWIPSYLPGYTIENEPISLTFHQSTLCLRSRQPNACVGQERGCFSCDICMMCVRGNRGRKINKSAKKRESVERECLKLRDRNRKCGRNIDSVLSVTPFLILME